MTIKKVRDEEEVLIHADKTCTKAGSRYYIHARRVAKAAAFILESGKEGEKYNIVGEKELDNLELAQIIAKAVGKPLRHKMVDFHSSRPGHDLRYALDGSKLEKMGFRHGTSIEEDIRDLVEWTQANPHWLLDRRIM